MFGIKIGHTDSVYAKISFSEKLTEVHLRNSCEVKKCLKVKYQTGAGPGFGFGVLTEREIFKKGTIN